MQGALWLLSSPYRQGSAHARSEGLPGVVPLHRLKDVRTWRLMYTGPGEASQVGMEAPVDDRRESVAHQGGHLASS